MVVPTCHPSGGGWGRKIEVQGQRLKSPKADSLTCLIRGHVHTKASDKTVGTRYTGDPGLREALSRFPQTPPPHTPALPFWCVNGQWKEDTFFLSGNACISMRTRKSRELEVVGTRKVTKTLPLKHEEWRDAQPSLYDNLFPSSWPKQNIHLAGFLSHTVGAVKAYVLLGSGPS